jgi:hypothetical protein
MIRYFLIAVTVLSMTACGQANSNNQNSRQADTIPSLTKDKQMDTVFFWKIMDYAFAKAKFDNEQREQTILDQLTKLTPEQIQQFEIIFQQMNQKASTWNNMAAHTIIEGGSSDDTYFYFRCWLISLGKQNFDNTLNNTDYLATLEIPINKEYGYGEVIFEELIPLSDKAYSIVTGKKKEDETFPRNYAMNTGLFYDSNTDITGIEWTEKDLPKIAPNLYKKFNK